MKISVEKLNNGEYIARPKGALGNVGWSPFPWTACYAKTAAQALRKFEQSHSEQINQLIRSQYNATHQQKTT